MCVNTMYMIKYFVFNMSALKVTEQKLMASFLIAKNDSTLPHINVTFYFLLSYF